LTIKLKQHLFPTNTDIGRKLNKLIDDLQSILQGLSGGITTIETTITSAGGGGAGAGEAEDTDTTLEITFRNEDLSNGVLFVRHNLGKRYPPVMVVNNEDNPVEPDYINYDDKNYLTVDLSSRAAVSSISGQWRVIITR